MEVKALVIQNNEYPCVVFDHYSLADCRNRQDCLFIFGDNLERTGMGGQAVIRPAKNAFGVVTKKKAKHTKDAYFYDKDFTEYFAALNRDLMALQEHFNVNTYKVFGWPLAGIGTGLAQLPTKAPSCFSYLQSNIYVKDYPVIR